MLTWKIFLSSLRQAFHTTQIRTPIQSQNYSPNVETRYAIVNDSYLLQNKQKIQNKLEIEKAEVLSHRKTVT